MSLTRVLITQIKMLIAVQHELATVRHYLNCDEELHGPSGPRAMARKHLDAADLIIRKQNSLQSKDPMDK